MGIVDRITRKLLLGDELTSSAIRKYFSRKYNINVGLYSYGCFDPARIYPNTTIGRYCSFASSVRVINRNHNLGSLSFTPYLYDQNYAKRPVPPIEQIPCVIEDDVWIGHGAIILPSAARVGRGAAIGAGAVVTRDVPAYAVVAGNPARVIRQRFSKSVIDEVEALKWWEWDSKKLLEFAQENQEFVYNINSAERVKP